jgi:hypothetical protein
MNEQIANSIYNLLIARVGASEKWRDDFVYHMLCGRTREYRFQGILGFGGKFYTDKWRVSCYPEDETIERNKAIETVNIELKNLKERIGNV